MARCGCRTGRHPDAKPVVWRAHQGQVTGVARESRRAVGGSGGLRTGTIRIRDREHPEAEPQGWLGRQSFITSVAVSGDGHWVATGGDDGRLWVWNREHPEIPPLMWVGHELSVNSMALSRDGRWLVAGQGDGTLWVGAIDAADLKSKACKFAARNLAGPSGSFILAMSTTARPVRVSFDQTRMHYLHREAALLNDRKPLSAIRFHHLLDRGEERAPLDFSDRHGDCDAGCAAGVRRGWPASLRLWVPERVHRPLHRAGPQSVL